MSFVVFKNTFKSDGPRHCTQHPTGRYGRLRRGRRQNDDHLASAPFLRRPEGAGHLYHHHSHLQAPPGPPAAEPVPGPGAGRAGADPVVRRHSGCRTGRRGRPSDGRARSLSGHRAQTGRAEAGGGHRPGPADARRHLAGGGRRREGPGAESPRRPRTGHPVRCPAGGGDRESGRTGPPAGRRDRSSGRPRGRTAAGSPGHSHHAGHGRRVAGTCQRGAQVRPAQSGRRRPAHPTRTGPAP